MQRYFYFLGEVGNLSYSSFRDSQWPQGHLGSFLVGVESLSYTSFWASHWTQGHLRSFLVDVESLSYTSFWASHWTQGHLGSFLGDVESLSYTSFWASQWTQGHLCSFLSSAVAEVPLAPRRPRCVVFFCLLESHDSSFLFATITLSARRYLDVYLVIFGNHYFSN